MRLDHLLSREEVRVVWLSSVQGKLGFLVAMRAGDTPVPIPNTMVKTRAADGTILETVWESRWPPDSWGYSSVGRAPALQAGGHEFESRYLHVDNYESSHCRMEYAC